MKFFQPALTFLSAATAFFAPVSGECDFKEADIVTELDLFDSEVKTNTLHTPGGELRYNNVGTFKNQKLDLRITVTSGDYTDIAAVWKQRGKDPDKKNGKVDGSKFGNINLQTVENKPKSGEGNFRFCFVEENTNNPVTLEQFSWTIFDLDERGHDNGRNGIGIKEKFLMDVSQAELFQVIDNTEVKLSCEDGSDLPCAPGIRTVFHSSTNGTGKDNPKNPNDLTNKQKARSVAFVFKETSCWDITYDHYCPVDQSEYTGNESKCRGTYTGGNFLFSGSAEQMIEEGQCITSSPTLSPTSSPTTSPTLSPTTSPTLSPTSSPTSSPTISPTNSPTSSPTISPTRSPTSSPTKSIAPTNCYVPTTPKVVSSVCMDGKEIIETTPLPQDALIIDGQNDGNVAFTVTQQWREEVGMAVKYDDIQLESSCDVTEDVAFGTATSLQAQCVDGITEATVVVYLDSNFDADECEACEVEELSNMGENFCAYRIEIPCEPKQVECGEPTATPTISPTKVPTAVPTATPTGKPTNPPTAVPTATPTAVPTASPTDVPSNVPTAKPKPRPTAEADTVSPTSLTTSITSSTSSTSLPTSITTTLPPDMSPPLPPPSCPEDVKLLRTDGITEIDLGQAVRIVDMAEDKSTVTVRLNQAWTSGTVDHIFYEYQARPFHSDCTEQTDVPGGTVYTPEDVTIQCMETKPIADLRICVADAGGFLDPQNDGATVPKCCHPDFDPNVPVVCYNILVRCESQCPDTVARRGLRGVGKTLE